MMLPMAVVMDPTKDDANYRGPNRGHGDDLRGGVHRMGIASCLGNHRINSIWKRRDAVQWEAGKPPRAPHNKKMRILKDSLVQLLNSIGGLSRGLRLRIQCRQRE